MLFKEHRLKNLLLYPDKGFCSKPYAYADFTLNLLTSVCIHTQIFCHAV